MSIVLLMVCHGETVVKRKETLKTNSITVLRGMCIMDIKK